MAKVKPDASQQQDVIEVHWKEGRCDNPQTIDLIQNAKGTKSASIDCTGLNAKEFLVQVRRELMLGEIDFELCDPYNNFKVMGPEFLSDYSKKPKCLLVHEKNKGPAEVTLKITPKTQLGLLRAHAGRLEYPIVFEEVIENSIEAIRMQQKKEIEAGKILTNGAIDVRIDEKERSIRFADNGSGMKAGEMGNIFALGKKHDRSDEEFKLEEMLGGSIGDFGQGMKSVFKFGMEEKRVTLNVHSKTQESSSMAHVFQDYRKMLERDDYSLFVHIDEKLDHTLFKANEHGTVIEVTQIDGRCFPSLSQKSKKGFTLHDGFLRGLASKFHLYVDSDAMQFLKKALRSSSAMLPADEKRFPLLNWGSVKVKVNGTSLTDIPNVVQDRLLELLADPRQQDDAKKTMTYPANIADNEEREEAEGDEEARAGQGSSSGHCRSKSKKRMFKPMWYKQYEVSAAGKTGRVMVVLYYNTREEEEMAEEDEGEETQRHYSTSRQKKLLVFWNGHYFARETLGEGHTLPFIEGIRKQGNASLRRAVDRVRGFVWLDGKFAPNTNKTMLNSDLDLSKELASMSEPANKRLNNQLKEQLLHVVKQWNEEDTLEDYSFGESLKNPNGRVSYEKVNLKKPEGSHASGKQRSAREDSGVLKVVARWHRKPDQRPSFVEAVAQSHGRAGRAVKITGTVEALYKTSAEAPTGTATIDVPYGEKVDVPVKNIVHTLRETQWKDMVAEVETHMPERISAYIHCPCERAADARNRNKSFKTVERGGASVEFRAVDAAEPGRESRPRGKKVAAAWRMSADHANLFQLMVEVFDTQGRLVRHAGREDGPGAARNIIDLRNLVCHLEVLDSDGNALPGPNGLKWTEKAKVARESDGARFFASLQRTRDNKLLNDFFNVAGTYQLRMHFSFDSQRSSVREFLDKKFVVDTDPDDLLPPGLSQTILVEVLPGVPKKLKVEMEPRVWLGEERPLKAFHLIDYYGNAVEAQNVIKTVSVKGERLEARAAMHGNDCRVVVRPAQNSESSDLVGAKVELVFEAQAQQDEESAPEGGGLGGVLCLPPAKARTTIMSGLPHRLEIDVPVLEGPVPPRQVLEGRVHVLDTWGNPCRGLPGELMFQLSVAGTPKDLLCAPPADGVQLTTHFQQGPVILPSHLNAMMKGQYSMTKGKLTFTCNVQDSRHNAGGKKSKVTQVFNVETQQAALIFVLPEQLQPQVKRGRSGFSVVVKVESSNAHLLQAMKLQVQDPAGEVLQVDSDDCKLVFSGAREDAEVELLRVMQGEANCGYLIDRKASREYSAEFRGLSCRLSVDILHGAASGLKILKSTAEKATVGSPWEVFFRVTDDHDVPIQDPTCFALGFQNEQDTGLELQYEEESLAYLPDDQAFRVQVVPQGRFSVRDATVKMSVIVSAKARAGEGSAGTSAPMQAGVVLLDHVAVELAAGRALKLGFISENSIVQSNLPCVSGEEVNLEVQALDAYGNTDRLREGLVTLSIRHAADEAESMHIDEEAEHLTLEMREGIAILRKEEGFGIASQWSMHHNQHFIHLKAQLAVANEQPIGKGRGRGKKKAKNAADPNMLCGQCCLEVSKGSDVQEIKVIHDGWDPEQDRITIDDSHHGLQGLKVSVVADDESRIPNATLEAVLFLIDGKTNIRSTPSADDLCIQEFDSIPVPVAPGRYKIMVTFEAKNRKIRKVFQVLRTEGERAAVTLSVSPDQHCRHHHPTITINAGSCFYVRTQVRNQLGVPVSFSSSSINFPCDPTSHVRLHQEHKLEAGNCAMITKIRVDSGQSTSGAVSSLKFTFPLHATVEVEQQKVLSSEAFHVRYIPQHGRAVSKLVQERNRLEKQRGELEDAKKAYEQHQAKIARLESELSLLPSHSELASAVVQAQKDLQDEKPQRTISDAQLQLQHNPALESFLELRERQELPRDLRALGVVAELGYVSGDTETRNKFLADGVAMLAGPALQAVVVPSEQEVDAFARLRVDSEQLRGLHTLRFSADSPAVDAEGALAFREPPPAGATFAVNAVCCDSVPEACELDASQRQRLRAGVWWPLLGSALIFDSEEAMEMFKRERGRLHRMTARSADGTWRVVEQHVAFAGRKYAEMRRATIAPQSREALQLKQELLRRERDLSKRAKLEQDLDEAKRSAVPCPSEQEGEVLNEKLLAMDAQDTSSSSGKRRAANSEDWFRVPAETPKRPCSGRQSGAAASAFEGNSASTGGTATRKLTLPEGD